MYRHLLLFPASVDHEAVERLVSEQMAPAFKASEGFLAIGVSVGALMGPGAHDGEFGTIVEAAFDTLETSMAAIDAESFQSIASKVESLGAVIYLFEVSEH